MNALHLWKSGAVLSLMMSVGAVSSASAQEPTVDPSRPYVSRTALEAQLDYAERASASSAYSAKLRAQAEAEAQRIRNRLELGDFRVADRVLLVVDNELALSDTFTVGQDRQLPLPVVGPVDLNGVLRSEVEAHMTTFLRAYIRDPVVRARALIPVGVVGGVLSPGFYTVPGEINVADLLMIAGGPTPAARVTRVTIERGNEQVWRAAPLQEAIMAGRTLDELGVRAGDRVFVPAPATQAGQAYQIVRTIGAVLALPLAVAALIAIFNN